MFMKKALTHTVSFTAMLMLTACGGMSERVSAIGKPPVMTQIQNPYNQPGYVPVSQPMPVQEAGNNEPSSLWQASRQTFFKDQRAAKVGDIVTVLIDISDSAALANKTERTRDGSETQGLPNFLGVSESQLGKVLPEAVDPAKLVGMNSASTSTGDGKIGRSEAIKLKLAATVVQKLPNGNFVIDGRQQVRVNYELRDLTLQGVIRPEDIMNNNSISYEKIAEARISYGGKGGLSDIQQPRYGQQFFDAVFPF